MEDPYVYLNSNVLINNFDIKDKSYLEDIETTITAKKIILLEDFLKDQLTADYECLKSIHKHIFSEIYPFAGQERTIQIYKSEKELYGDTVRYPYPKEIKKDAKKIISDMDKIKWNKISFDEKVELFAKNISALWQVHPFREGNTRTTMIFASFYAEKHGFALAKEYIAKNSDYVRDSLVLASDGMYANYEKINKLFKEAIELGESNWIAKDIKRSGFHVTEALKSNMKEMSKIFGRLVSVKEVKEMYLSINKIRLTLEQKEILQTTVNAFISEEKSKINKTAPQLEPEL